MNNDDSIRTIEELKLSRFMNYALLEIIEWGMQPGGVDEKEFKSAVQNVLAAKNIDEMKKAIEGFSALDGCEYFED